MTRVAAEFLVEPFSEGAPGPHVEAALDHLSGLGLEPEQGPFGNVVRGDSAQVLPAVAEALQAALAAGATRVTVNVETS